MSSVLGRIAIRWSQHHAGHRWIASAAKAAATPKPPSVIDGALIVPMLLFGGYLHATGYMEERKEALVRREHAEQRAQVATAEKIDDAPIAAAPAAAAAPVDDKAAEDVSARMSDA